MLGPYHPTREVAAADTGLYVVADGDTIEGIALQHDITLPALLRHNSLRRGAVQLYVGQVPHPAGLPCACSECTTPFTMHCGGARCSN